MGFGLMLRHRFDAASSIGAVTEPYSDSIEHLVLGHLDELGADYDVIRIDPAFANTALFCREYGYAEDISANCIVVASKTGERKVAACLVLATTRLDVNGTVRRLIGARKVSFAPAEDTVALTGMLPDGVTPFGLPADLPLFVDARVVEHDRIIVGGGSRSLKLLVDSSVFEKMPQAQVIDGLSRPA